MSLFLGSMDVVSVTFRLLAGRPLGDGLRFLSG